MFLLVIFALHLHFPAGTESHEHPLLSSYTMSLTSSRLLWSIYSPIAAAKTASVASIDYTIYTAIVYAFCPCADSATRRH